jgi:hypothetical protein
VKGRLITGLSVALALGLGCVLPMTTLLHVHDDAMERALSCLLSTEVLAPVLLLSLALWLRVVCKARDA